MEQRSCVYVPILDGPSRLALDEAFEILYPENEAPQQDRRRTIPYLRFKCQGQLFNPWLKLSADEITQKDDNYYVLCHGKFAGVFTLVAASGHEFTLRPGECYDFEINYNPNTRRGRVSSIGLSKKSSPK